MSEKINIHEITENVRQLALKLRKYREVLSRDSIRILGREFPLPEQLKDELTAEIGEMESQMDQEVEKLKKVQGR